MRITCTCGDFTRTYDQTSPLQWIAERHALEYAKQLNLPDCILSFCVNVIVRREGKEAFDLPIERSKWHIPIRVDLESIRRTTQRS